LRKNERLLTTIPQQSSQNILGDVLLGLGLRVVLFGGIVVVAEILNEIFSPTRNDEPLAPTMRRYIRERDGEICFYCEEYAPGGHVDHRVSRANGGSNHPKI